MEKQMKTFVQWEEAEECGPGMHVCQVLLENDYILLILEG